MTLAKGALGACAALALTACASTKQFADLGFRPPEGSYRLLVMRPDVSVGLLTTGGLVEAREEWTVQARANLLRALTAQQATRGGLTTVAATRAEAGGDPEQVAELERLHTAVGNSIRLHKYLGQPLPTKQGKFDWVLGEPAIAYGRATGYDYALFVHAEDSFASTGRVALQAASLLGCMVGVCLMPAGGQQTAFASLVDLRTGQVVWYNALASGVGDIRAQAGADKMVAQLLGRMKPGAAARAGTGR